MSKFKVTFSHRKQRSVLTDMLPFEVPPSFSNKGFYTFIKRHQVEIDNSKLSWIASDGVADSVILFLMGLPSTATVSSSTVTAWGKTVIRKEATLDSDAFSTTPMQFVVSHKNDGRQLSIVHPRNQIKVAAFLARYFATIIYFCGRSEFSIRRPVSVSRYTYHKDKLHQMSLEKGRGVEQEDREYEQMGSYFVYRKFRNIHQFFESSDYHRCEKRFRRMVQVDVARCFDSIYTHSIAWAIVGKNHAKLCLKEKKLSGTFFHEFDALMQALNIGETNGIVIGPEFSRVFAELIMQSVDVSVLSSLRETFGLTHRVDYEIFRYVDDYFIFYDEDAHWLRIKECLQTELRAKKLSINTSKVKHYERPILTELTMAKDRVSTLLNEVATSTCEIEKADDGVSVTSRTLRCSINQSHLIVQFKSIVKVAGVEYTDILNYALAIVENKTDRLLDNFERSDKTTRDLRTLIDAVLALLHFAFFIYAASPRVNHTIRLTRTVISVVGYLNRQEKIYDMKHLVFKSVSDNIVERLGHNRGYDFKRIESLYLLTALSVLGREYLLPQDALAEYFCLSKDASDGSFKAEVSLSHFELTTLIGYVGNRERYLLIRQFLAVHLVKQLQADAHLGSAGAERLMLALDAIACPYLSTSTKDSAGAALGLSPKQVTEIGAANNQWFTAWGKDFRPGEELDAKRSREVY